MTTLAEEKQFEIRNAKISDLNLVYSYEILVGVNKGDLIPNRKGANQVHQDLSNAMDNLIVFLAHIDGVFSHWANNQTSLEELEENEEISSYYVTGFKLSGSEENKSVIIVGGKETIHGVIDFETPKIKLNGSYLYLHLLEERLYKVIEEVELYHNGKVAPQMEQQSFDFGEENEPDFENAKVD